MTEHIEATGEPNHTAEIQDVKQLQWLYKIWVQPRAVFKVIARQEKAVWLVPLVTLSLFQVIKNAVEGPIRTAAAQAAQATADLSATNMGYLTDKEVAQIQQGAATTSGPIFTILIPAVLAVLGIWLSWVILGSILHLGLTLAGNRNGAVSSLNVSAWASLPFAVRLIIQIIATLATRQVISAPGLSGFFTPHGTLAQFAAVLLGLVDIYLIWQVVYLVLGARQMGNIARGRVISTVIVCVLIVLALQAVPGTISRVISGMSFSRPYFF